MNLDDYSIKWATLPDGGDGYFIASAGDDLHLIGPTAPLVPGGIGCIVIDPDGGRRLARLIPDPLDGRRSD